MNLFIKRFKCSNKSDVKNSYQRAIEQFSYLNPYNLDIVFVGIDYDDNPKEEYGNRLAKLYNNVNQTARQKAVIFFPVQAIEHWLIFLQHRAANPSSTKTITIKIENTKRAEAKRQVYGHPLQDKKELIINLVQNFDVEWLCTQSHSFREFNNRILHVIK